MGGEAICWRSGPLQGAHLNIWEGVFQQADAALSQSVWVEGLFPCLCLQVLGSLHQQANPQDWHTELSRAAAC